MVYTLALVLSTGSWAVGTADSIAQAIDWRYSDSDIFPDFLTAQGEADRRNKIWAL
jgi:hypothetical protein